MNTGLTWLRAPAHRLLSQLEPLDQQSWFWFLKVSGSWTVEFEVLYEPHQDSLSDFARYKACLMAVVIRALSRLSVTGLLPPKPFH